MTEFLFQPSTVEALAIFILNIVLLGYLLSRDNKSSATLWLALVFFGFSLFFLSGILGSSLIAIPNFYNPYLGLTFFMGTGLAVWALMQFSYQFLKNPFEREYRWVLAISTLLLLLHFAQIINRLFIINQMGEPDTIHSLLLLTFILWGTLVLLRKWRHSLKSRNQSQENRDAKAYLIYASLNLLLVTFLFTQSLINLEVIGEDHIITNFHFVFLLSFFFGIALVYINHAPEPTTLQVKLVGLALITAMAMLVIISIIQYPNGAVEEAYVKPPQKSSLQFIPDSVDGYRTEESVLPYNKENLGTDLMLEDDSTKIVSLDFSFPFGGKTWNRLFVSPNGAVTFGEPIYGTEQVRYSSLYFFTPVPKIAPFYADLDASAGGGVYLLEMPGKAVVSWHNVPLFGREGTKNFVQLVLERNGAITFIYDTLESSPTTIIRGLSPKGESISEVPDESTDEIPKIIKAGTSWFHDFNYSSRHITHNKIKNLIWLTIGMSLFILFVFPFFFRSSIIKPLDQLREGVQRVNAGELDTEVPVGVRDEIGYLTHHFNIMTASLRKADKELKNYADSLEQRVAERTAELESKNEELKMALKDLKQAQNQLVYSEKMASLGQLTAGIAHEIKNPLNFVNNFSEVSLELVEEAQEELGESEFRSQDSEVLQILGDVEANLKKILEHGQRADGIVRSMLLHSRGKSSEPTPTDLNKLIDEYVKLAYHGMRAVNKSFDIDIQTNFDKSIGVLNLVAQDLSRAILNIINNAMYAAYEYAKISNNREPFIKIATQSNGNCVNIHIRDNGPGIPDDIREKIFEPFFTTKPTGEGTGLGLSMTYDIINLHKGSLQIQTKAGEFTEFIITLPINSENGKMENSKTTVSH